MYLAHSRGAGINFNSPGNQNDREHSSCHHYYTLVLMLSSSSFLCIYIVHDQAMSCFNYIPHQYMFTFFSFTFWYRYGELHTYWWKCSYIKVIQAPSISFTVNRRFAVEMALLDVLLEICRLLSLSSISFGLSSLSTLSSSITNLHEKADQSQCLWSQSDICAAVEALTWSYIFLTKTHVDYIWL